MPTLLFAGLATVDLIYQVPAAPTPDEKAQATSLEIAAGGPATNAAVTAAALGAQVTLVTAIGSHPLGELVRADLEHHNVRVIDVAATSARPPPVSSVIVPRGSSQRMIVSRNAGDLIVSLPPEALPTADLTLVDGHHPALALPAARAARRLLLDAGHWRPIFTDLFPHADVVACSAAFIHPAAATTGATAATAATGATAATATTGATAATATTGATDATAVAPGTRRPSDPLDSADVTRRDADTATAVGAPYVVVTHGAEPVRWFGPAGSRGEIEVPPVRAVDTAGAGDAFHGALAVALAEGGDLPEAIAFAIRVAGVRVTHPGPRSWLAAL
jgi:sugar/nucleoside kinase (ribokinase family)